MNKKTFFTLALLGFVFFARPQAKAQEATDSGSFDPAVVKKLGDRVKKVVDEKKEQIKGAIDELEQKKRGFIGQIERLTEESMTIENRKGTQIVPLDETVTFLKNGQAIDLEQIAVEDWVVVMGLVEDETFKPKRILVSSANLRPKTHQVVLGTIVTQSQTQLEILSRQEEQLSFELETSTEFQNQTGEAVSATDLIEDLQVLIVVSEDDEGKQALIVRALAPLENSVDNE